MSELHPFFQLRKESELNYWVVIPAAGTGERMGSELPKQYLKIDGRTILQIAIEKFFHRPEITGLVVAVADEDPYWPELRFDDLLPITAVTGGAERYHSVYNALKFLDAIAEPEDWVLVHDAARPCLSITDLSRLIESLAQDDVGGILAHREIDTVKQGDDDRKITRTLDRTHIWHAMTPQMFRFGPLKAALADAIAAENLVTDEASAMELAGFHPRLIEGSRSNIKVTGPDDLVFAAYFLGSKRCE